jgi:hypothetical protein
MNSSVARGGDVANVVRKGEKRGSKGVSGLNPLALADLEGAACKFLGSGRKQEKSPEPIAQEEQNKRPLGMSSFVS